MSYNYGSTEALRSMRTLNQSVCSVFVSGLSDSSVGRIEPAVPVYGLSAQKAEALSGKPLLSTMPRYGGSSYSEVKNK